MPRAFVYLFWKASVILIDRENHVGNGRLWGMEGCGEWKVVRKEMNVKVIGVE
jgi:hypothetical protein